MSVFTALKASFKHGLWVGLLLLSSVVTAEESQSLDGIVAIVNDNVVTTSQLQSQMAFVKNQILDANAPLPTDNELQQQVLQQLIEQQLVLEQARKNNVEVSNAELNDAIDNVAAQHQMNIATLKTEIAKQGLTWEKYRDELRIQLAVHAVEQQQVASAIKVSPDEITSYMQTLGNSVKEVKEYHLEAILVSVPEAPAPDVVEAAAKKAQDIIDKLGQGESFEKLAVEKSAGDYALKGGDMGWRQLAELPKPVADQIEQHQPGSIIGPLQTPVGFYIINFAGVREQPVKHFVQEYKVRHILIHVNALTTDEAAKVRLQMLREKIEKGESFAKVAEKYSQDPNSAMKGGSLGWVILAQLPVAFGKKVEAMVTNEVSQPFQTQFGWELIQVLDKRQINDTQAFMKERVAQFIFQRKYEQEIQAWIQKLHSEAYVKITLPESKSQA